MKTKHGCEHVMYTTYAYMCMDSPKAMSCGSCRVICDKFLGVEDHISCGCWCWQERVDMYGLLTLLYRQYTLCSLFISTELMN